MASVLSVGPTTAAAHLQVSALHAASAPASVALGSSGRVPGRQWSPSWNPLPHSPLCIDYPRDPMHTWGKLALNYRSGNYSEDGATDLMTRRLRANEVTRLSLLSSLMFETNNEENQERTQRHQWRRCLP